MICKTFNFTFGIFLLLYFYFILPIGPPHVVPKDFGGYMNTMILGDFGLLYLDALSLSLLHKFC